MLRTLPEFFAWGGFRSQIEGCKCAPLFVTYCTKVTKKGKKSHHILRQTDANFLRDLVEGMPKRVEDVVKANGGPISK